MESTFQEYHQQTIEANKKILGEDHPLITSSIDILKNDYSVSTQLNKFNKKLLLGFLGLNTISFLLLFNFSIFPSFFMFFVFSGMMAVIFSQQVESEIKKEHQINFLNFKNNTKTIEKNILIELQNNPNILKELLLNLKFLDKNDIYDLAHHIATNESENIMDTIYEVMTTIKNKSEDIDIEDKIKDLLTVNVEHNNIKQELKEKTIAIL